MGNHIRRSSAAVVSIGALCLVTSLGGAASALGSKGIKGDPQPELKPFTVQAKSGGATGSVAIRPDGTLLAAYNVNTANTHGAVKVCILKRAGKSCASDSPTIPALSSSDNSITGNPAIFALNSKDVDLLTEDSDNGAELYSSTDGGVSFGASPVGLSESVGVSEAEQVGSQIVWGEGGGGGGGVLVAATSATAPVAPAQPATVGSEESETSGLGSYKGGVLVANGSFDSGLIVSYAPAASDLNNGGSYTTVGHFPTENFEAIDGPALLTHNSAGTKLLLRIFNGSKFGTAHVVPHGIGTGGPEDYVVDVDPTGEIHVFTILAGSYNLDEESTSNGSSWTSDQVLANATISQTFASGLDSTGSGAVLGIGAGDRIYPVLARQSVSLSMKSRVTFRHHLTASGAVRPKKAGRTVTLQQLKRGLWYTVATTKEKSSGRFRFTLKDKTAGSFTYRAVAADTAGFVEYGYSSARHLKVVKRRHH